MPSTSSSDRLGFLGFGGAKLGTATGLGVGVAFAPVVAGTLGPAGGGTFTRSGGEAGVLGAGGGVAGEDVAAGAEIGEVGCAGLGIVRGACAGGAGCEAVAAAGLGMAGAPRGTGTASGFAAALATLAPQRIQNSYPD